MVTNMANELDKIKDNVFLGFIIIAFLLLAAKVFGLTFSFGL